MSAGTLGHPLIGINAIPVADASCDEDGTMVQYQYLTPTAFEV